MANLDVLIPHFNDSVAFSRSLESIEKQEWSGSIRVVVCDDGSTSDHRNAVERRLEQTCLTTTFVINACNRGRPYTRNRLLDAIDSNFVSWLDAGDVWHPAKTRQQFNTLFRRRYQGGGIDNVWVTCDYSWKWEGGRPKTVRQAVNGDQLKHLLIGNSLRAYLWTLLGSSTSFKRIGGFDERLPRLQDLDYFINFVSRGGEIISAENQHPLCTYYKSDLGKDCDVIAKCINRVYEKNLHVIQRYGPRFAKMRRFNGHLLAARFAQNNGEKRKKASFLLRAAIECPVPFIGKVVLKGFKL